MNDPVRLTVEWKVEAERVTVTYQVTNNGPPPVYVIDGSFRAGPGGAVWSDRLQVGFRPPETAVLGSRLPPLNPLVSSAFPPAAYAVRLATGESHESTLTAPLPLVPDGTTTTPPAPPLIIGGKPVPSPFPGGHPPVADKPIVCRAARFELGVVPHDEALRPLPVQLAGRDVFRLEATAWSLQRLLAVEQRPFELRMLVPAAFLEPSR